MFVLALGSLGCVGVGLLAECVTTFRPEVVSLVVSFVSAAPFVPVFTRAVPLGADPVVGMSGDETFVPLRGRGVFASEGMSLPSIVVLCWYSDFYDRNQQVPNIAAVQCACLNPVARKGWKNGTH